MQAYLFRGLFNLPVLCLKVLPDLGETLSINLIDSNGEIKLSEFLGECIVQEVDIETIKVVWAWESFSRIYKYSVVEEKLFNEIFST